MLTILVGEVNFQIGSRSIGPGHPCFIIAEVGLAHDGSLSQAHAYVDAAARAGVDAVKFQCHLGDKTSGWRIKPEPQQDEDRQAYWGRTGFSAAQWQELARDCAMSGVEFLCSPFSIEAVALLDPLVSAWKVPSGQITDRALLDAIGATRKPVLLSTGMATWAEAMTAVNLLTAAGCELQLMQCHTSYPSKAEDVGLPLVAEWGGLSDHSGTPYPGIAAAALGCQVLEVHICFSRDQGGLDTAASITTAELADLVRGVRFVERAMRPVDKDEMAERLAETRRVFMGAHA